METPTLIAAADSTHGSAGHSRQRVGIWAVRAYGWQYLLAAGEIAWYRRAMRGAIPVLALAAACVGPDDDIGRSNNSPQAALRAPVIAPVGDGGQCVTNASCDLPRVCDLQRGLCRVVFDAGCVETDSEQCVASLDTDGDPLTYAFQFNDGSPALHTSSPAAFHTFEQEGIYTVFVEVTDIHGASSLAAQDVSVRSEFPDPPDFCDAAQPCAVGDECVSPPGLCYVNHGAL